jgi:hypothetical protein
VLDTNGCRSINNTTTNDDDNNNKKKKTLMQGQLETFQNKNFADD